MKSAAFEAMAQIQRLQKLLRALVGENVILRQALINIKADPDASGRSYQIAKQALEQV